MLAYRKLVYNVREASQILGVSTDKIYELVQAKLIPHKRVGRQIRIPVERFHEWIEESDDGQSDSG